VRTHAVLLVQHAIDALGDLQRLDESLYERFREGSGGLAEDAAPGTLLRRLSLVTFRGLRGLLVVLARARPNTDPSGLDQAEADLDFGLGEAPSESTMPVVDPAFDLARALGDAEIDDALDLIDEHVEADEATRWKEVGERLSAIDYGLRSELRDLEGRLDGALAGGQVAQALEILDDTRSSVSEGVFALLAAIYGGFLPEVEPATVAPGHLTTLQRALLVRRGLTDLGRLVSRANARLQEPSSPQTRKDSALSAIRAALESFVSGEVFPAMRPADRWEIAKVERALQDQTGVSAALTCEGFAKYLESLGSINQREVLVLHDERAFEELRETLAAARGLLDYNAGVARTMVGKALALADSLYGRSPGNDDLILALRETSPTLEQVTEIEATLSTLELLLSEDAG
jgi:hypothetical protein